MFTEAMDGVLVDALLLWGRESQNCVAIGEIGELLTLYGKEAQGRATPEQWVDEIADCFIMLRQLAMLHDRDRVEKRIAEKVERLRTRIATQKGTAHGQATQDRS